MSMRLTTRVWRCQRRGRANRGEPRRCHRFDRRRLPPPLPGLAGERAAAAIAAGETSSPELEAASGEVGTLPRWQAWTWLLACLLALAVVPFATIPFRLTERVPVGLAPETLRARALDILGRLGHVEKPADTLVVQDRR